MECYIGNIYKGFREKTKFLHQCVDRTCTFDSQSIGKPGCYINSSERQWEECSIPKCSKTSYCSDDNIIVCLK